VFSAICVLLALKVSVGAGTTATSVVTLVVPPTPRHESENFFVPLVRSRSVSDPEAAFVPVNGAPLAVQLVASSLRQLSCTDPPGSARSELASSVTFGTGKALTVTR
jgi:hypothetical protein